MVAALLQTAATPVLLHPSIPHPSTSWYTFRDGAEAAVCVYTHTHTHRKLHTPWGGCLLLWIQTEKNNYEKYELRQRGGRSLHAVPSLQTPAVSSAVSRSAVNAH